MGWIHVSSQLTLERLGTSVGWTAIKPPGGKTQADGFMRRERTRNGPGAGDLTENAAVSER